MDYTSDGLIALIKNWATIPDEQPAYSNANLRLMLTKELHTKIVPIISSLNQEYFIRYTDYTITADREEYRIPSLAVGSMVREIKLVNGDEIIDLQRLDISSYEGYQRGFYFSGNNIVLINPENFVNYSLRVWYERRPNEIIDPSNARAITAINGTTVTVANVPTTPTAWTESLEYDLVKATPHFAVLADEQTVTISGADITFSSLPTGLAVGDYVCIHGESPVANIPYELHDLLCQAVIVRIKNAIGGPAEKQTALDTFNQMAMDMEHLIADRNEGEPEKVVNTTSFLDSYWI